MYNFSLNVIVLTITLTVGIVSIVFLLKDNIKRKFTIGVFLIVCIMMALALKNKTVEPPIPEPVPVFSPEDIIEVKGIYKGHVINSMGEKEFMSLLIQKHRHEDSIKMIFVRKKRMSSYNAKYYFQDRLIVTENSDSAYVTKNKTFINIRSKNKINNSWEFERVL
ncbi:hypothetical protein Q4Q35_10815 [Flavivirga aquimarina]|uniref:Uncharacterized protein n=1 Tax=Flavivirga aquimarina TaxID=2027862 RepID=A0ABT8WB45_9FLAO|nr:hypothetical protein [Flavivirga aquimarina]MDO5970297.1 hypothetical protein [Flavivirga aquimarina]